MELRLPADKVTKATLLVNRLARRRTIILRDLQSLIGLFNFACLAVTPGRAFLRRLINLTIGVSRPHNFITLNSEARADLQAWQFFFNSFNGRSVFFDQRFLSFESNKLYTDASSDIRFVACFGKKWVDGKYMSFSSADITLPELYPLVLVTELFIRYLANHSIIFMTDNSGVVEIVNQIR